MSAGFPAIAAIKKEGKMKKTTATKMILVVLWIIFVGSVASAFAELPDFSSWTILFSGTKDYNQDGIDDVAIEFLSEHPNPFKTFASAIILRFQPFSFRRIDMAIVLFYTRTSEAGKDTILSVRLQFYVREEEEKVICHFLEERILRRPQKVEKIVNEPMFKEDSLFGQKWFQKFHQFGLTDEEIRQAIPKWGWLPE